MGCFSCENCENCKNKKILTIAGAIVLNSMIRKKVRRQSNKKWIQKYRNSSVWETIAREMQDTDLEGFQRWVRLSRDEFYRLVHILVPHIQKEDTILKQAIPVDKRIAITLVFLSTGCTYFDLSIKFAVGYSTVSYIISECLKAISVALNSYITLPSSEAEWKVNIFIVKFKYKIQKKKNIY